MSDRDRVIHDIERCIGNVLRECSDCSKYEVGVYMPTCMEHLLADARELLEAQPKWISVKDRLPPDGKAVIGYTPVDGCMFVGFYKTYKYSWQDTAVGYWYILTARGSTKQITKRVTQWIPLPDPPERADMK